MQSGVDRTFGRVSAFGLVDLGSVFSPVSPTNVKEVVVSGNP